MDSLLHELATGNYQGVGPPLLLVAGPAADSVVTANEDRLADDAAVEPLLGLLDARMMAMVEAPLGGAPGSPIAKTSMRESERRS